MSPAETIGVIGLGYVGLPVATAFARRGFAVTGFDIDERRIAALEDGRDWTGEVAEHDLRASSIRFTSDPADLAEVSFYIVTVPTPIDRSNRPDLGMLTAACEFIGPCIKPGDVVVFESTVYPGATEEVCAPVLERTSGLRCGADFKIGYSPERINPGDKEHPFEEIVKVVSAQDSATLDRIARLYDSVIDAGVYRAPSIKVAEAAKVIENTQRDVNIALMNELARICHLLEIRTSDVLQAAATKWNFLRFYPGLVGGHCVGVDPYYLTAKAEALGYHPEVILSGRRINDGMGAYIARQTIQRLALTDHSIRHARVGMLGLSFKENVPDIRNSKAIDIVNELRCYAIEPIVHDPLADPDRVMAEYRIALSPLDQFTALDALIITVRHDAYGRLDAEKICGMIAVNGTVIDVKSCFRPDQFRSDIGYWSL